MSSTIAKIAFPCIALVCVLAWQFEKRRNTEKSVSSSPAASSLESALLADERVKRRFFELESRREQMNQTVWRDELAARAHGEVFVKLWDSLRLSDAPWTPLEQFAFGELRIGTPVKQAETDHGIVRSQFGAPLQSIDSAEWKSRLAQWRQQGFRLDQSEWRHVGFHASTNRTAASDVEVTLNISKPNANDRLAIRGILRVRWEESVEPGADPIPAQIDATRLRMVSRRGEPMFDHVAAADFTPETPNAQALEPNLQVYDLNGDGLSEIILARRNRLLWNKGQGKFQLDDLCAFPLKNLNAALIADFDGNGTADLLAVDPKGLALFHGNSEGRFTTAARRTQFTRSELPNPFVMTAGDIDNDGDLDLWLAQYKVPYQGGQIPTPYYDANDGYPSYLLINDGKGGFADRTDSSGLAAKRFRRTYSASFIDLDEDLDLDLLVASDFAGVDLYRNDGSGRFGDATHRWLSERHCFGMAHTFGDFDLDTRIDFFVIGMNSPAASRLDAMQAGPAEPRDFLEMRSRMSYGNRMMFGRDSVFEARRMSDEVARTGWSWGVANGDFDNDGDLDLHVVNGHISGQSVRDYESEFWCHDIYGGSSKSDPALDLYFQSVQTKHQGAGDSYGGFEKNRLYLNQGGASFIEAGFLAGTSMEEDCRNAIADDLDGDGKLDLLATTFQVWPRPKQVLHLFPNFCEKSGNWIGARLRESRPGFSPVGAKVVLSTSSGTQIRYLVTGDSYRSQHSTTAHFGIGSLTGVDRIEVLWPNGKRALLSEPAINQYHTIIP